MTPFTEGYIEALREALPVEHRDAPLADETLARIIADCAHFLAKPLGENSAEHGRRFWSMRVRPQIGAGWHPDYPPLTPTLRDDGKVYLAEVQS